jgi:tetratricopeptide (TPR) repeat protein
MAADTYHYKSYRRVLLAIAALVVGLQLAALGPLRGVMWGSHLYAFVPLAAAIVAWLAVLAGAVWLARSSGTSTEASRITGRWPSIAALVAVAVTSGVVFWLLRSRQELLGDAVPLMIDLPTGKAFHPRQPLAMWLQQQCYHWFAGTGADASLLETQAAAARSVAIGSVIAGVMFVFVVAGTARLLARARGSRTVTWLVGAVVMTQGYAVLFFGYVENYTYQILAIGLYLLAALAWLERRLTLSVAAVALVLATGVHLSSIMLVPSFAFLAVIGARDPARRRDTAVGILALAAAVLALDKLLGTMSPGYSLWSGIGDITGIARTSQGGGAGLTYMFSLAHLRDFVSDQILVGPLAALLFLAALAMGARDPAVRRHRPSLFLAIAAGAYLIGSWSVSEPLLGYARDWDLFAAAALTYTLAGVSIAVRQLRAGELRVILAFAVLLSLSHLVPFVWINHSPERSIERFATLPLGRGKTETTIANYYFRHGDYENAEAWFKRGLAVDATNPNANSLLGRLYAGQERWGEAAEYLGRAVRVRPDKVSIRKDYALVLLYLGRCDLAGPNMMWLVQKIPDDLDYWHMMGERMSQARCDSVLAEVYRPLMGRLERRLQAQPDDPVILQHSAIMLFRVGRADEAIARFRRAYALSPGDPSTLFNLAWTLDSVGDPEGRALLEEFIRRYPQNQLAPHARTLLQDR